MKSTKKFVANSSKSCGSATATTSLPAASLSSSASPVGADTNGWKPSASPRSGTAFEQAVTLAESGKAQEAEAAFAKLANDGTAGYRVLSRLREAAELARSDPKAAIKAYRGDRRRSRGRPGHPGPGYIASRPAARRPSILCGLAQPIGAFDRAGAGVPLQCARIVGASAWKQGDASAAKQWTEAIIGDPQTPAGARNRAEVLSQLIAAGGKG